MIYLVLNSSAAFSSSEIELPVAATPTVSFRPNVCLIAYQNANHPSDQNSGKHLLQFDDKQIGTPSLRYAAAAGAEEILLPQQRDGSCY